MTGKHGRDQAGSTVSTDSRRPRRALVFAAILAVGVALPAAADRGEGGGDHYDRVTVGAERSRQVANDQARAQLGITLEDTDAVELQYRMNEVMQWAVDVATHYADIDAQTGGYRAFPVYKNQLIDHWRATQELRIESTNVDRVTELVRVLQSRMQLQDVSFSITPELRESVENELIGEVLGAFQQRAELVRGTLGAGSYRIVHVSIGTGGTVPAPMQIRAMSAMAEAAPGTAPALEPGTSTVTVTVDGRIELRP